MQLQSRIDTLRKKVGYLDGLRKVLVMAELAECLVDHDPAEAISIAVDAEKRARSLIDRLPQGSGKEKEYKKVLAYTLVARSDSQQHEDSAGQGTHLLEEAALLLEEAEDWDKLFDVLDRIAINHRQHLRMQSALEVIERALSLAEVQRLHAFLCYFHAARAATYGRIGKQKEAEADLEASLTLLEHCTTNSQRADAYSVIAEYFYIIQNYEKTIEYNILLIDAATPLRDHFTLANAYRMLNFCYLLTNQRDKSLPALQEGYRYAREGGLTWLEAALAIKLGSAMLHVGNFVSALRYFYRCEELFGQIGDHPSHIDALSHIGFAHIDFDDEKRGRLMLRRALVLTLQNDPHPLTMRFLAQAPQLGFWESSELEDMITYAAAAREYTESFEGTEFFTWLSMCLGAANTALGRNEEARTALFAGLEFARGRQSDQWTLRVLLLIVEYYIKMDATDEALRYAREAESLFNQDSSDINWKRIVEALVNVYERRGDFESAFGYLRKLQAIEKQRFISRNHDIVAGSIQEIEFKNMRRERDEARRTAENLQRENEELLKKSHANAMQVEFLNNSIRDIRDELRNSREGGIAENGNEQDKVLGIVAGALSTDVGAQVDTDLSGEAEFIKRLAEKFPTLSKTERKVCSLVKSGAGSKDICKILNVSSRTVGTYRYRIRQKMQLDSDTNLNSYIINL